ncbi:MAG: YfiR family protein [Methylotenera sp.]|nr:YfiR family protein [Methylotenera sp.]MDP1597040.1 YfiR family protein [Methylotenera sp.]MDP1755054.1 YfiR family protein [Methylotenera sp.]MDP1959601.1 YfiR family protein [Methylotenera sp.]MDP2404545.1 YfiR family protein [Methylotenera sp.]
MKLTRLFFSLVFVVALLSLPRVAVADPVPEYQMKAAYLYNFATLITWPTHANKAVRLCVLGSDSFGGALQQLTRNSSSNTRITLSYLANMNNVQDCQILFIDVSALDNPAEMLKKLEKMPVLTVTDNLDLFNAGAMIGLFLDNKRLVFDVNYAQAKNAQLSISAKLLRVARKVMQ